MTFRMDAIKGNVMVGDAGYTQKYSVIKNCCPICGHEFGSVCVKNKCPNCGMVARDANLISENEGCVRRNGLLAHHIKLIKQICKKENPRLISGAGCKRFMG